jgi:hypothetical protein
LLPTPSPKVQLGLERVSSAGTYGKYPANLFRDLLKIVGNPVGAPPIDWVQIPMKSGRREPHPVIWPHKFFQSLCAARRDIFDSRIRGPEHGCHQFWDFMKDTEFVRRHPFLPEGVWDKTVPIGMHGDGGAFNKQDSLITLAWNSLTATGTTVQTRFLFTVIKNRTWQPIRWTC